MVQMFGFCEFFFLKISMRIEFETGFLTGIQSRMRLYRFFESILWFLCGFNGEIREKVNCTTILLESRVEEFDFGF